MTSQRKNILVGLTVLGAFVVLGWMIVQFGGRLGRLTGGAAYPVHMTTPRANGLSEGAQVLYLGAPVGRVESIQLNTDRTGFDVTLRIDLDSNLPANVVAAIRSMNPISGAAAVALEPEDGVATGSLRDVAEERVIVAEANGTSIIPEEFGSLAEELRSLVSELRESGLVDNVNQQVTKVGEIADSLNALVGDEQLRGDVKASVTSIREAAASAERIGKELEEFSARLNELEDDAATITADAREISGQMKQTAQRVDEVVIKTGEQVDALGENMDQVTIQIVGRLEQINGVLGDIEQITSKINNGEGTAGKLVNDDRLYEALVLNMQLLETTVQTTNRLLRQWEQEGIRLRLFR